MPVLLEPVLQSFLNEFVGVIHELIDIVVTRVLLLLQASLCHYLYCQLVLSLLNFVINELYELFNTHVDLFAVARTHQIKFFK